MSMAVEMQPFLDHLGLGMNASILVLVMLIVAYEKLVQQ
jgi:hypothetical protein